MHIRQQNWKLFISLRYFGMRHCKNIINDNLFMLYILNSYTYLWLFVRCWYLNNFIDFWSSKCMPVYFCLEKTKINDHSADCWLPNFNFITDWWSCSYLCVLKLHQVSLILNEKQKSLNNDAYLMDSPSIIGRWIWPQIKE